MPSGKPEAESREPEPRAETGIDNRFGLRYTILGPKGGFGETFGDNQRIACCYQQTSEFHGCQRMRG